MLQPSITRCIPKWVMSTWAQTRREVYDGDGQTMLPDRPGCLEDLVELFWARSTKHRKMNKSHMEIWSEKVFPPVKILVIGDVHINGWELGLDLESLTIDYERYWFEWEHNYVLIKFNN